MSSMWAMLGTALLATLVVGAHGQYDDFDFADMMGAYDDLYGGGGMGGMGGMMDMMGMGGMGGMGGYGGGYGYGGGSGAPAHTDLTDVEDVGKFMFDDVEMPAVIGFFNEDTQSDDVMAFRTTASRMENMGIRFGLATEDDVLEKFKYTAGRVMAYPAKRFIVEGKDRTKLRYPGAALDVEPLQKWIAKVTTPLVGMLTWESGARYQELGFPELMAFKKVSEEDKEAAFDDVASVLRKVASSRPTKEVSYVVADPEVMEPLFTRCKFPQESVGKVLVGLRMENAFYRMDEEFSEEALNKFVQSYVAGSLQPVHVEDVDEAPPLGGGLEEADDSAVVVLTPENVEAVVKDEGTDVMIEFYAPWCGHCQQLQPVYAEVAEQMSSKPSVVIAKMDADAHTPDAKYGVRAYPTIVFLKAGDKSNPVSYDGPRTKDAILAFLEENMTTVPPVATVA